MIYYSSPNLIFDTRKKVRPNFDVKKNNNSQCLITNTYYIYTCILKVLSLHLDNWLVPDLLLFISSAHKYFFLL